MRFLSMGRPGPKKTYFILSVLSLFLISVTIYITGEDNLPPLIPGVRATILALYANIFFSYFLFIRSRESLEESPGRWAWLAFAASVLCLMHPVFSGDLMEYLIRGRMLGLYHASPYRHLPLEFPNDLLRPYSIWYYNPDAYGPLSVYIQTLPALLFPASITGMIASYKGIAMFFFGVSVVYFWKIVKNLGVPDFPRLWAVFAYCPFLIISTAIDGHNDVIMMAFSVVSLYFFLEKKYTRAFLFWTCAFLVKYMVFLHLPFMVILAVKHEWKKTGHFPVMAFFRHLLINFGFAAAMFTPLWAGSKTFLAIFRHYDSFYTNSIPYMLRQGLALLGVEIEAEFLKNFLTVFYAVIYGYLLFRCWKLKEVTSPGFFRIVAAAYLLFYCVLHSPLVYWYLLWALFWIVLSRWPRTLALVILYSLLALLSFYKRINYLSVIALVAYGVCLAVPAFRKLTAR